VRENKAELFPNLRKLKEKCSSLPTLFVTKFTQGIICLNGKQSCNSAFYQAYVRKLMQKHKVEVILFYSDMKIAVSTIKKL
jgi:hypothetical protein